MNENDNKKLPVPRYKLIIMLYHLLDFDLSKVFLL